MLEGLLVALVPIGALAALGGAYSSATLPILAAAVVVFLVTRARVASGDTVWLDAALAGLVAGVLLQIIPLPHTFVSILSPHLDSLRAALYLDSPSDSMPLSVNVALTRAGLASLASTVLVFWAARDVFARGGVRMAASIIAATGFALIVVSLVQRTTAPGLLLWMWKPSDPGAKPFGPFVNPNHLATWLLMAASVTAGYLVSHNRALGLNQSSFRLQVRDWLADGRGMLLAAALVAMVVGIAATLSRAAIIGAAAALAVGTALSGVNHRGRTGRVVATIVALVLGVALWSNRDALARKFEAVTTLGRLEIWRETVPVLQDFWAAGTGVGTYGPTMLQYQSAFRDVHFNQAHSEYVQTAAEGGLLVVVPLIVALGAALRLGRQRLQHDRRPIAWVRIGAVAGLAGAAAQGLFETGLRIPANGLLAAVLAGIALHHRHDR